MLHDCNIIKILHIECAIIGILVTSFPIQDSSYGFIVFIVRQQFVVPAQILSTGTTRQWGRLDIRIHFQKSSNNQLFRLDTAMKKEKELMRTTVTNILEKVPNIKRSIEDIKSTNDSLLTKEDDLDDVINDRFDQLVAMIEQRRTCLLNQLHFRVSSKREKLGKPQFII